MLEERGAPSLGGGDAGQETFESSGNAGRLAEILFVVGICLYLYTKLFTFKGIPILLGGDQIFFWMDAKRLLLGERIYLDFFQFTPPGTDVVYLAFFKLFGPRIWVHESDRPHSGRSLWLGVFPHFSLISKNVAGDSGRVFVHGSHLRKVY